MGGFQQDMKWSDVKTGPGMTSWEAIATRQSLEFSRKMMSWRERADSQMMQRFQCEQNV